MRISTLILFLFSCSSFFISESNLNNLWVGKNHAEVIDIIGPYQREVDNLKKINHKILIWEASKENINIPIDKLGTKKNKWGTSITSIHIYIDENGYITDIKKSVY